MPLFLNVYLSKKPVLLTAYMILFLRLSILRIPLVLKRRVEMVAFILSAILESLMRNRDIPRIITIRTTRITTTKGTRNFLSGKRNENRKMTSIITSRMDRAYIRRM